MVTPPATDSGVPSSILASGSFLLAPSTRVELILHSSTCFITMSQPFLFGTSTTIVQTTRIQSALSACVGGSRQKEWTASVLKPYWKTRFLWAADCDSTRTTGQTDSKENVLWLEASTASLLCIHGHMLSMLLPSRPGKLLIKRMGKNRGNKN